MTQKPEIASFLQHFRGETSQEEAAAIEHWRTLGPENEDHYQAMKGVWEKTADLTQVPTFDLEQGWQRLREELQFDEQESPIPLQPVSFEARRKRKSLTGIFALAACVLITALIWYWVADQQQAESIHIATKTGEQREIALADGSKVWLDGSSTLTYPQGFSSTSRAIRLEGHAYFEVVPETRIFVVETSTAKVKVLGTAFDVWAGNGKTRVVVREGSVSLKRLGGELSVALGPNQFSECTQTEDPLLPTSIDAFQILGWLRGDRNYLKQPLADVLVDLERIYGKSITLEKAALGEQTLTATFGKESLEEILEELCLTLNMKYREKEGTYFLTAER